jgi:hypothetical protein
MHASSNQHSAANWDVFNPEERTDSGKEAAFILVEEQGSNFEKGYLILLVDGSFIYIRGFHVTEFLVPSWEGIEHLLDEDALQLLLYERINVRRDGWYVS